MKPKNQNELPISCSFLPLCVFLLRAGREKEEMSEDDYVSLKNVNGEILITVKSLNENNQYKD